MKAQSNLSTQSIIPSTGTLLLYQTFIHTHVRSNAYLKKKTIFLWIALILLFLGMNAYGQTIKKEHDMAKLLEDARLSPKDTLLAKRLVGTKAPDWQVNSWLNADPIQLTDLLGKVVLVRWFTEGCPFCSATAPSLNHFYQQYHKQGLEVIGFYHHKSKEPLEVERVHRYAKQLKFNIPVAIDYDWQTLQNWWLDQASLRWTSVSFLIDRQGNIQYVHPGGAYIAGDADYKAISAKIEQLLGETNISSQSNKR